MGVLTPIEATPPFDSVGELVALVTAFGEAEIVVSFETREPDLLRHVVHQANGTTRVGVTSAGPDAAQLWAAYARQRAAAYLEARRGAQRLRVWADRIQIDGLQSEPIVGTSRAYTTSAGRDTAYSVSGLELETSLEMWRAGSGEGPVVVSASGVPTCGLEELIRAVGTDEVQVECTLSCGDALELANARRGLSMSWAAGVLHMELPEYTARRYHLAPVPAEARDEVIATFDSVRGRSG